MRICFDMDGTIADLYGVENWLAYLVAEDTKPYAEAKALLNLSALARRLNKLQRQGHKLVVISWTSKCGSAEYDKAVAEVKKAWLAKHLPSVRWDEVNVVAYGYSKANFAESAEDVLFDDEERNRNDWTGRAYGVADILGTLATL
ncbi:MAG: hypothetical protein J5601_02500 [Elusimicrobiaceae bacterium]|nr:hypothetical protein [Elusimicrobiaceae bacterium]